MKPLWTLALFAALGASAQSTKPATQPANPTSDCKSSYDRFKDQTTVSLVVHSELGILFSFPGRERKQVANEVVVFGNRGRFAVPQEIIFLVDEKRVPLEFRGMQLGVLLPSAVAADIASGRRIEAAVIYPDDRVEITFGPDDIKALRELLDRTGYPEMRAQRNAALARQRAADNEGRLRALSPEKEVIYIIDASGSMMNCFDMARQEVQAAVDRLPEGQLFNVLIAGDSVLASTKTLTPKSADSQRVASSLLETASPHGSGAAIIAAFSEAVGQGPQDIVLFTDGDIAEWQEIRSIVLGAKAKVRLSVIDLHGYNVDTMTDLAASTGGRYLRLDQRK